MRAVDEGIIDVLTNRFQILDLDSTGLLNVGSEVPSAQQVEELQKAIQGTSKTLVEAWTEYRIAHNLLDEEDVNYDETAEKPVKLAQSHDFSWSGVLYRKAFEEQCKTTLLLLVAYGFLGYLTMAYYDSSIVERTWFRVEGWYFISATVSTVGLGDYAPQTQVGRGFATVMIPFGLIVLSLALSAKKQYDLSRPISAKDVQKKRAASLLIEGRRIFEVLDPENKIKTLSKDEVVACASRLNMTKKEAESLFDFVDTSGDGSINLGEIEAQAKPLLQDSVYFKFAALLGSFYLMVFVGALFFKVHTPENENNLTWVDAFYLATVVATSIGYGDICPVSHGGKLFLFVYMPVSTILTAYVLGRMIEMYVHDIIGSKIDNEILESTTWVHKIAVCDPEEPTRYFQLTEADYVMFKLLQMQKVVEKLVDQLIDRFIELDFLNSRSLAIGVGIPSGGQVKQMQELTSGTGMTLQQAWDQKLKGLLEFHENPQLDRPPDGAKYSPMERKNNGSDHRSVKVHPVD